MIIGLILVVILLIFLLLLLNLDFIYNKIYKYNPEISWDNFDKFDEKQKCIKIIKNITAMNYLKDYECNEYNECKNIKIIKVIRKKNAQILGLIIDYKDTIFITFGGTHFSLDINSALFNSFDIRYVDLGYCKVHKGYYNLYKKYIEKELHNFDKNIIISGYSMGGALAILSYLHYNISVPKNLIKCYTFGTPKFGDIRLYNLLKSDNNIIRIEYEDDNIPKLCARDFYNIGKKKIIKSCNKYRGLFNCHYWSYIEHYNV